MEDFRFDTGRIYKHERTDEGYLRIWMTVGKVGDLTYFDKDGSHHTEHVSADTLFDKESMDTAWGKAITYFDHPKNEDGKYHLINNTNTTPVMRGMTQQGMLKVNDTFLTVVGVVVDKDTIDGIESGINQVSAGYKANLSKSIVDSPDGIIERYDQVGRRYNHFTILPKGRAGEDVKVHYDCTHADIGEQATPEKLSSVNHTDTSDNLMEKVTINFDGANYPVDASLATLITSERNRFDSDIKELNTTIDTLKSQLEELEKKYEEKKGAYDAVSKELEGIKNIDHSQEMALCLDAWGLVLPAIERVDTNFAVDYKMSLPEIKKTYLTKVHKIDTANKSNDYINGMFDILIENQEQYDAQVAINKTNEQLQGLSSIKRNNRVSNGQSAVVTETGKRERKLVPYAERNKR
jgi:hypothetical protein